MKIVVKKWLIHSSFFIFLSFIFLKLIQDIAKDPLFGAAMISGFAGLLLGEFVFKKVAAVKGLLSSMFWGAVCAELGPVVCVNFMVLFGNVINLFAGNAAGEAWHYRSWPYPEEDQAISLLLFIFSCFFLGFFGAIYGANDYFRRKRSAFREELSGTQGK